MGTLRIAFFGSSGDFAMPALRRLALEQQVVAIVQARRRTRAPWLDLLRRLRGDALSRFAREHGIPHRRAAAGDEPGVGALLSQARPDVICIAGYRWVLPPAVLAAAPLGGLNLHGALLPRHRGILPLFWIYHADDRETGVTVHTATDRPDAGDIVAQEAYPLPRGHPVARLNRTNGERGAALLAASVSRLAAGTATPRPQDERLASPAPMVRPGTPMTRFDAWDVERVWHFLAGLHPWYVEPLRGPGGGLLRYGGVTGYEHASHDRTPGTVERAEGSLLLFCRGGVVRLSR